MILSSRAWKAVSEPIAVMHSLCPEGLWQTTLRQHHALSHSEFLHESLGDPIALGCMSRGVVELHALDALELSYHLIHVFTSAVQTDILETTASYSLSSCHVLRYLRRDFVACAKEEDIGLCGEVVHNSKGVCGTADGLCAHAQHVDVDDLYS